LSNKRLCCILKSRILVRDLNEKEDTEEALKIQSKELDLLQKNATSKTSKIKKDATSKLLKEMDKWELAVRAK
jgi:hypothetical protein